MTEAPDLHFASLADVGARLRDGRLSSVALTEHVLGRIAALDPQLHAFITVTADLARAQARDADRELRGGRPRGPLHGVPMAIKDFYDTAGIRTTAALDAFRQRVPTQDADLVVRLREAGAVLVGKTNMHKLGMGTTSLDSDFGAVVHPLSAAHVAGGSSGGSAAALAAGLCFATVDTDAIGSGRLPAAICGVACLKPSFGVLSGAGILAGEPVEPAILLLSHPTVMARSADDLALAFGALSDAGLLDRSMVRRVGIAANYTATDEVRSAFEAALRDLAAMGIERVEVEVPFDAASFDVSTIDADRRAIGATLFGTVEAIALPTLAAATPTVEEARARGDLAVSADNTFFCNYFGLPAVSVPCGVDRHGVPLGLQFVGPPGADGLVLALARAFQQARGRVRP